MRDALVERCVTNGRDGRVVRHIQVIWQQRWISKTLHPEHIHPGIGLHDVRASERRLEPDHTVARCKDQAEGKPKF